MCFSERKAKRLILLDDDSHLQNLISRAMPADDRYAVEGYIKVEDSVPVCVNSGNDSWDESFLEDIEEPLQIFDKLVKTMISRRFHVH